MGIKHRFTEEHSLRCAGFDGLCAAIVKLPRCRCLIGRGGPKVQPHLSMSIVDGGREGGEGKDKGRRE